MDLSVFTNITTTDKIFDDNCLRLTTGINAGHYTIVELVEQLGPLLTNPNPEERSKGTLILSVVLENLPINLLASTQLSFISDFFADRLKDHHQVVPGVFRGILALIKCTNLPDGSATKILVNLFQQVACQQQQQLDRLNIYKIFKGFLESKPLELKAMSFDFVYGVIVAMDSERDPNNLRFLFGWLPTFIKSVTLGHLTEEMFEVVACYFPVDFRTPSQERNPITRDELASLLCNCLCAIPEFGEFCLPLAFDKLSSTLRVAKMDSLDLLSTGCKVFEPEIYSNNINELWSIVQTEVFKGSKDTELEEACLKTLANALNRMSEVSKQNGFSSMLNDKISTLKGNLLPDSRLFVPTTKFLTCLAAGSKLAAELIVADILPIIIETYNITTTTEPRIKIFQQFYEVLKVTHSIIQNVQDKHNIKQLVIQQCLKAAVNSNENLRSMGFQSLGTIAKLLDSERTVVYENLKIILLKPQPANVRESVLQCFKTYAEMYSEEIKQQVLDNLNPNDMNEQELLFDSLKVIVSIPFFMADVLNTYISYIQTIDKAALGLKFIKLILEENPSNNEMYKQIIKEANVIYVIKDWSLVNLDNNIISDNISLMDDIVDILKICSSSEFSNKEKCIESVRNITEQFKENNKLIAVPLVYGLLCQQNDVEAQFGDFVNVLIDLSYICQINYIHKTAVYLLANILNKMEDNGRLKIYLNKIEEVCSIEGSTNNAINLITFITKALLMRGSTYYEAWSEKLLKLLEAHDQAAESFQIVMSEKYDCLCPKSNSKIKLLYRQRFFTDMTTKINERYEEGKINYLLAYGFLLQEVQQIVFRIQFAKVIRLTVLCLENSNGAAAIYSVLDKLAKFLEDNDPLMEEHLQEFLPRFLKLTKYKQSLKVRMKALECVRLYTTGYTLYKLLPFKQDVIYNLIECLDDPKRLVRQEAVTARSAWFLLDAPM